MIGVVVPTLGQRPDMLIDCLTSIRSAGETYVVIVGPQDFAQSARKSLTGLFDAMLIDPGQGLAAAVNLGLSELPSELSFITWLGDDDLLQPGALDKLASHLKINPTAAAAFGRCEFIDSSGRAFGKSKFGKIAVSLLRFGPDYIPQPASLFRREFFEQVGGLDNQLKFAFDLDLFLKLSRIGKVSYIPEVLAKYRWHVGSLSADNQAASRAESRKVRYRALPKYLRLFSPLWEAPMEFLAPKVVSMDRQANSIRN